MGKTPVNARCEICIYFKPDDKFKHILKITKAKNPNNEQAYDQVAGKMGYDASTASDLGTCTLQNKRMNDTNLCNDFFHDMSKNY